jgi:hypothetical protein
MFERVLPTLGRFLGGKQQTTTPVEERRVWVRYPCRTAATVHSTGDSQFAPMPARARNVSRGGVLLVVGHRIEAGELISIELPGEAEGSGSVLACVLNAQAAGESEWALHCSFATELSPSNLQLFDVEALENAQAEQRSLIRYSCQATATYELVGGDSSVTGTAAVTDVSIGGIGLAVEQSIALGTLLNLHLRDATGRPVVTMITSVVTARPASNGRWLLGCNFLGELSEEQLAQLV